jgi:hypothetical protein
MKTQEYLDKHYPKWNRSSITEIKIGRIPVDRGIYTIEEDKTFGELDLSDFPNLKKLTLYCFWSCGGNKLQDITIKDLSKNTELEEVEISSDKRASIDIDILSPLTKLKKLNLHSEFFGSLKSLENCKELNYLDINNDKIEGSLEALKKLTKLQYLSISNGISNSKIGGSLEYLKDCHDLRYLNISNSKVEGGLEYLPSKHFIETGLAGRGSKKYDRQFVCINTPFKEQLKPYNYDIEA